MCTVLRSLFPIGLFCSVFDYDKRNLSISEVTMIRVKLSEMMGKHKVKNFSELERATGITRKTLTKLYDGEGKGIDYVTLNALCSYFQCSVGDLLEFVPDETKT
jgi:putative transcriptional regulator